MRGGRAAEGRRSPASIDASSSSRSIRRSFALWYRRSGSFASARRTTRPRSPGSAGLSSVIGFGVSLTKRRNDRHARGARKRPLACRHLVEHDPKREEVRPRVDRFPFRLFGRHVRGGAENLTDSGDHGSRHRRPRPSAHAGRSASFASPKSSTLIRPPCSRSPMRTLPGFRSRWVMPFWCAAATASATAIPIFTTSASAKPPVGISRRGRGPRPAPWSAAARHRQSRPSES